MDESGDVGNWQQQNHFVIAGIGIYEFRIHGLENRFREVQRKYFPEIPTPIVFHATDIHAGKDVFRELTKDAREQLFIDLYNIVFENHFPNVIVFGAALGRECAVNIYEDRSRAFEEVISSFNSFLVENYRVQQDQQKHVGNRGLVIIDKNREEQYKQLLDTFLEEGTKYGYLANIVDIPYFARCRDTPMLQLADLCAYAIFRFYAKNDDTYFNLIRPRLYHTIHGRLFGLKHITKKECTCISCTSQATLT